MPDKSVPSLPDAGPITGTAEYFYLAQTGLDRRLGSQALLDAVRVGRQQCQLILSGANLLLRPFDGTIITINSKSVSIPDAGVTLAPTGLTVNQLYYIYAWMSGTTLTLEASPTIHAVQAGTGIRIKSGDATRTLVGMARPVTGPIFQDSAVNCGVRSYYNRVPRALTKNTTADRSATATAFTEFHTEIRVTGLLWADDLVAATINGAFTVSNANEINRITVGLDSVANTSYVLNAIGGFGIGGALGLTVNYTGVAEGYHTFTAMGSVQTALSTVTLLSGSSLNVGITER